MFMNTISKKMNMMLLAAMVACAPVCAAENQSVTVVAEQQDATNTQDSVVWYKKRSTHIMAALAATAVGIYVLAVRKNKIAGPVALFTLFCANKKAPEVKNVDEVKDAQNKQQDAGIKPQGNATQQIDQNNGNKENKPVSASQEIVKNSNPADAVNPEDSKKIVTQEETSLGGEVNPAENKEKNGQPLPQVEKNAQVTSEAPLHIKAQGHLSNAVSGLTNWLKQGLVADIE